MMQQTQSEKRKSWPGTFCLANIRLYGNSIRNQRKLASPDRVCNKRG